jgi:hypothetical protein
MEIVNLVFRDHRSLEERESYVSKCALLRGARGPVFALHHTVVSGPTAECDPVPLIVSTHSGESA